jgi:8-amino-7-oxononanoate synthase
MDGDCAPLQALQEVAVAHDAWLLADDAHGFGMLGSSGRGWCFEQLGTGGDNLVLMATLGKALGTGGAFVAGSEDLIETLIQRARTYIYTTAAPPALAWATRAALRLVRENAGLRQRLSANIQHFKHGAGLRELPLMKSDTAIQPLLSGDSGSALAWSDALRRQGLLVTAIRPPTVPRGSARLRITLSASHTLQQIDRLLEALACCHREAAHAAH